MMAGGAAAGSDEIFTIASVEISEERFCREVVGASPAGSHLTIAQ